MRRGLGRESLELDHSVAVFVRAGVIGFHPNCRHGIRDSDAELGHTQQRVVVLRIADRNDMRGKSPRSSSAAARPVAVFTDAGRTITAPLLKITCISRPRSRIVSSRMVSLGCTVETIDRPTDTAASTPRAVTARSQTPTVTPRRLTR